MEVMKSDYRPERKRTERKNRWNQQLQKDLDVMENKSVKYQEKK